MSNSSPTYEKLRKILNKIKVYQLKPDYDAQTLTTMRNGTELMITEGYSNNSITENEYRELMKLGEFDISL